MGLDHTPNHGVPLFLRGDIEVDVGGSELLGGLTAIFVEHVSQDHRRPGIAEQSTLLRPLPPGSTTDEGHLASQQVAATHA